MSWFHNSWRGPQLDHFIFFLKFLFHFQQRKVNKHDLLRLAFFFFVCLFARLGAGRDQAYHLARWAQDGRPGRIQHSHCVERCAWGLRVPTQERTDPQVSRLPYRHHYKTDTGIFIPIKCTCFVCLHVEGLWKRNASCCSWLSRLRNTLKCQSSS